MGFCGKSAPPCLFTNSPEETQYLMVFMRVNGPDTGYHLVYFCKATHYNLHQITTKGSRLFNPTEFPWFLSFALCYVFSCYTRMR